MAETTVKIRIPKTVHVQDSTGRELRAIIAQMAPGLVTAGKLDQAQADAVVAALMDSVPPAERDYPISEFVDTILNTAPSFTGSHSKVQRLAYRLGLAFEGKAEGDVVELEPAGHDLLKAYFEKPEYTQTTEKGERRTVEGVVFAPMVWRKCCVYADSICEPLPATPADPPAAPAV